MTLEVRVWIAVLEALDACGPSLILTEMNPKLPADAVRSYTEPINGGRRCQRLIDARYGIGGRKIAATDIFIAACQYLLSLKP